MQLIIWFGEIEQGIRYKTWLEKEQQRVFSIFIPVFRFDSKVRFDQKSQQENVQAVSRPFSPTSHRHGRSGSSMGMWVGFIKSWDISNSSSCYELSFIISQQLVFRRFIYSNLW